MNVESDQAARPFHSSPDRDADASHKLLGLLTSVVMVATAAVRIAGKHLRITWIKSTSLPRLYVQLGRRVYEANKLRNEMYDSFRRLDELRLRVMDLEDSETRAEGGWKTKLRLCGDWIVRMSRAALLRHRAKRLQAKLGMEAHRQYPNYVSMEDTAPVRQHLDCCHTLTVEIRELHAHSNGNWLTPTRFAVASLFVVTSGLIWMAADSLRTVPEVTSENKGNVLAAIGRVLESQHTSNSLQDDSAPGSALPGLSSGASNQSTFTELDLDDQELHPLQRDWLIIAKESKAEIDKFNSAVNNFARQSQKQTAYERQERRVKLLLERIHREGIENWTMTLTPNGLGFADGQVSYPGEVLTQNVESYYLNHGFGVNLIIDQPPALMWQITTGMSGPTSMVASRSLNTQSRNTIESRTVGSRVYLSIPPQAFSLKQPFKSLPSQESCYTNKIVTCVYPQDSPPVPSFTWFYFDIHDVDAVSISSKRKANDFAAYTNTRIGNLKKQREHEKTLAVQERAARLKQTVTDILQRRDYDMEKWGGTIPALAKRCIQSMEDRSKYDQDAFTWQELQRGDERFAFYLAAADAPDDLIFGAGARARNSAYYEKMKSLVDPTEIHRRYFESDAYSEKISAQLSKELFGILRWDKRRIRYLVNRSALARVKAMLASPVPSVKAPAIDGDPSRLFNPAAYEPRRKPQPHPAWTNYIDRDRAKKFWAASVAKIKSLDEEGNVIYFLCNRPHVEVLSRTGRRDLNSLNGFETTPYGR